MKINIINRKSKFDYFFERSENGGIMLVGSEVKSIREGKCSLVDAFCHFENGELFIKGMNIPNHGKDSNHEAIRNRKILLTKKELVKLEKDLIKGMTLIPYRLFENDRGIFKVEVCLAKGKKQYDKRETIKKRDAEKELKSKL